MDNVLEFLAQYSQDLSYDKLPKEVVHEVKRRVIDTLGCAIGAHREKPSEMARAYALEVSANPGATVMGTKHVSAPEVATFANGVAARYFDFNDTGMSLDSGHPSDNIPPVLAAAEYAGADARAAITGIVLAYEVQGRFSELGRLRSRGWDYVTAGAFSSAAGAGKVLGLNPGQMANALAIAATANATTRQSRVGSLSMWKGCAAANASRNGVFAALMARRGLTGPEQAFQGRCGFFNQVMGAVLELPAFGGNGRPYKVQDAKYKYYPTDYECQTAVHPALELRQALGGQIDQIEKITVDTYELAVDIAADTREKWDPKTRETADHSLPYVLAVALKNGTVWLDDFSEERIRDPHTRALMQKVEVRKSDEFTRQYPQANGFRIEVLTKSGEKHVREILYAKGSPRNPMTDREIEAKFHRLAEPLLKPDRQAKILDCLWSLEKIRDVREVLSLFAL